MKPFKQYLSEKAVPDSEDIEMELVRKVEAANAKDLKELPGKSGETAHNKLHSVIGGMVKKMKAMHEAKDGDYTGAPPENPMTDEELEAYYKEWKARKGKK
jgi:hypothetical protein